MEKETEEEWNIESYLIQDLKKKKKKKCHTQFFFFFCDLASHRASFGRTTTSKNADFPRKTVSHQSRYCY